MGDAAESELKELREERAEKEKKEERGERLNTVVALIVAVAATFLAICSVKDGNITSAASSAQANAVDTWAFFQAKSTKQHVAESVVDQMQVRLDTEPLSAEARAVVQKSLDRWKADVARYETEKRGLTDKARRFEADVARLNARDNQFDVAEALFSVGIALMGITAVTKKRWLFAVASVVIAFGFVTGVAGFADWTIQPAWLVKLLN